MNSILKLARSRAASGSILPPKKRSRAILFLGLISWLSLTCLGLWVLSGYQNTPGIAAEAPRQWPAASRLQPAQDHPTLVMLAHPRCPCSRASIGELASIMAHSQGRLSAYVLFIKPQGSSEDWEQTDLWESASNIPGVKVILDSDGKEARLFDAATSGQTVLYDREGRLLFRGGITGSRGHFGDNAGQASIIAIVNAEVPDQTETSVFGCPLFDRQSECRTSSDERDKH